MTQPTVCHDAKMAYRTNVQRRYTMFGTLTDYRTGESLRPATREELLESLEAALHDGGIGAFEDDEGRVVYVEGGEA